jgi:hypothetical protein
MWCKAGTLMVIKMKEAEVKKFLTAIKSEANLEVIEKLKSEDNKKTYTTAADLLSV